MARPITTTFTRRRTPLWHRALLYALGTVALIGFFFGGSIVAFVRSLTPDDKPEAKVVRIEFGESDAGISDDYHGFYRYELVPIRIRVDGVVDGTTVPIRGEKPTVRIYRGDDPMKDGGRRRYVPLEWSEQNQCWEGNWLPPYGSTGVYRAQCSVQLEAGLFPPDYNWTARRKTHVDDGPKDDRLRPDTPGESESDEPAPPEILAPADDEVIMVSVDRDFELVARTPAAIRPGLGAVSWEELRENLLARQIRPPGAARNPETLDGKKVGWDDWTGIFKWLDLYSADVLWYSAYSSDARFGEIPKDHPWYQPNLRVMSAIGRECHDRGYEFGAYALAYKMNGPIELLPDYKMGFTNPSMQIAVPSLLDETRISDLAYAVWEMNENPNIDWIGLDYIRDAEPSFDGVDRFVEETHPPVPDDWESYSFEERKSWLRGELVRPFDRSEAERVVWNLWNWWRAHRVSEIIRDVKAQSGCTKPMWAFTLSARHGSEHGQDPYMFQDAGIDLVAPMLYQMPSQELFDAYLSRPPDSWRDYSQAAPLNLAPGNQVDYCWNQLNVDHWTTDPPVPQTYYDRTATALRECRYPGTASTPPHAPIGVFCHDLNRTMETWYGGYGDPYWGAEWAFAGAALMTDVRRAWSRVPVDISIEMPGSIPVGVKTHGMVAIYNHTSEDISGVAVTDGLSIGLSSSPDIEVECPQRGSVTIDAGQTVRVPIIVTPHSTGGDRSGLFMVPVVVRCPPPPDSDWADSATTFRYIRVR